jgi:hypothetical protein
MLTRNLRMVATAATLFTSLSAAHAAPTVVYREVFPNDFVASTVSGPQAAEATAQGWYAAQHGGTPFVTQNGQIAKPASGSSEVSAVNSNPQGSTADTGFLFFSPSQRAGIFMYTGEVASLNLSTADLRDVIWESRNSSANLDPRTNMRLAFLVGGQWFISSLSEQHSTGSGSSADWEINFISTVGMTYQLFNDNNSGEPATALPRNNDNSPALQPLPVGTVDAVGLWMEYNTAVSGVNPTIRIDNFSIVADVKPVPLPGSLALLGLGLAGLAGLRRARRNA